ncbi:MAG: nucleotide sugar dehydrogenase [Planctomycetota bacterium]
MRVSIFGMGYVGAVTSACLAKLGHRVVGVDPNTVKLDSLRSGRAPFVEAGLDGLLADGVASGRLTVTDSAAEAVAETELSIVCVGTPSKPDGSFETRYIEKVCGEIAEALESREGHHTVVIRSTVLPGTTEGLVKEILTAKGRVAGEDLGLAMNPEFLREGTSLKDFYDPPFTVVGTEDDKVFGQLVELYGEACGEAVRCAVPTAEMIKYSCNLFHAAKITFANEIGMLAKSVGVDSRDVMDIVCRDTKLNISPKYMRPGFAFGGSCLPKDLRGLLSLGRQNYVPSPMLESMLQSNRAQVERLGERVVSLDRRNITLIGLSFKEGTDDLRESPLVSLAEYLIGKGFDLKIYCPDVTYASLHGANKEFIDRRLPHLKRSLCTPSQAAAHGEVFVYGHKVAGLGDLLGSLRFDQVVIDLDGGLDPAGTAAQVEGLYW